MPLTVRGSAWLPRANPIDETVSLQFCHQEKGVLYDRLGIAYQAPTKWTFTSLYENVSLKRSAIDIIFCVADPTAATVSKSLFGSEYSSYALNMIDQGIKKEGLFETYNGICVSFPL